MIRLLAAARSAANGQPSGPPTQRTILAGGMRTQGPLPRCLNRIPRTGLPARPHIRSRLCPQALRVGALAA